MSRLPRPNLAEVLSALVVLVTTILVLFLIVRQEQSIDDLRAQYDALHQDYERLYEEAIEAGAEPEAPAPDAVPEPEATPEPQTILGPTQEQIREAVAEYCANVRCKGDSGDDGSTPSQAVVLAAVTEYCSSGTCTGATGQAGSNGADGEAGATGATGATGDPGRPPTPEEIAAAVSAYCANDACRGPAGTNGADSTVPGPVGPVGPPGPVCPDGWTQQTLPVMTRDGLVPTWVDITTCVAA